MQKNERQNFHRIREFEPKFLEKTELESFQIFHLSSRFILFNEDSGG